MATTNTWDQVVEKISGVVNRGAFSKTFTPTASSQNASGGAGYYSSVSTTCNAVSLTGNAGTGQVLSGYTFYNTSLTKQTGTMANRGALNWTPSGSTTYAVPAGYYSGGTLNSGTCYTNGYNAGVTAGRNTISGTMTAMSGRAFSNSTEQTNVYTASSAGYYLAYTSANGTGFNNGSRKTSISTNGTKKSGGSYWVGSSSSEYSISTSQTNCQFSISFIIAYLNSGNTITMTSKSNYNASGTYMVFKLG